MGVRIRVPDYWSDYFRGVGMDMEIDLMRAAEQGLVFHEATGQKLSPDDLRDMEIERLQAENAKLKAYVEKTAEFIEGLISTGEIVEVVKDYRADFPKETEK